LAAKAKESEGEAILRPSRRMDCFRIVSRERAYEKRTRVLRRDPRSLAMSQLIAADTAWHSSPQAAVRIERDQIRRAALRRAAHRHGDDRKRTGRAPS